MAAQDKQTRTISYYPPKQQEAVYVNVLEMPDTNGKIVMDAERDFYYYNYKKGKWVKVSHGIYHLYRALSYMLLHYIYLEVPELERAIADCDEAHEKQMFINTRLVEAPRMEVYTLLCGVADWLRRAIDDNKRDALMQVAYCVVDDLKDSMGRLNNGVLQCRTATAKQRLGKRLEAIESIQQKVLFVHERVGSVLRELERTNNQALDKLESALSRAEEIHRIELEDQHYYSIRQSIRISKKLLYKTNVKPFTRTRERLLEECDTALQALEEQNLTVLHNELSKMVNSLRLKYCRSQLEYTMINIGFGIRKPEMFGSILRKGVVRQLEDALDTMTQIDETGFVQPVCVDANETLLQAILMLDNLKTYPPEVKHLKQIRHLMDKAIGML